MKKLGIIVARKGSQRFPNKHHVLLLGKPMFAYTLEASLESKLLDRIVVSSDDFELKKLTEQYGIEFITRPPELATAASALDDAVRHVCRYLEQRDEFQPDVVLTFQGNVPIRKEGQIDDLILRFKELPKATAICTAQESFLRPEWASVITDEVTGEATPFLQGKFPYRTQDFPRLFYMDGAIYGVRIKTLWEQEGKKEAHAWFGSDIHLILQDSSMYSHEIDYPHQVQLAEFYLMCKKYGDAWYKDMEIKNLIPLQTKVGD